MSETLYDAFDKLGKKQNKEQVPPAGEPPKKKPSTNKASKTSSTSNTVTRETHKNLAEAFKAVSKAKLSSPPPFVVSKFYIVHKKLRWFCPEEFPLMVVVHVMAFEADLVDEVMNEAVDGGIFKPVTCASQPWRLNSCLLPRFLSQLDVGDLKQQLAHSQTLFPENPSVWFKDLAGYLNLHLVAPDTGPTLANHPHGRSVQVFPAMTDCGC